MAILSKYYVSFTNNRGEHELLDVMAYDGYDARRQVMSITCRRAQIIDIWRA